MGFEIFHVFFRRGWADWKTLRGLGDINDGIIN
jgi:hypothetical protein